MIGALCNHRFIPGNGIIGGGAFFKRNSERMEELKIFKHLIRKENSNKKKITRITFENFESKTGHLVIFNRIA